ncbi:MAG: tRNA (adenosine(37)-N6)-threonylcarbamoyltransferase complex ATPase subunit type 1 TsaE [Chitinophagaceae bacterium]|nr:tRNA (adenosine(37)-N6)-threonylcarbamoyltransferase complex ATPase subunit type 1 TsaE [Chitinophagaceae bacterium]
MEWVFTLGQIGDTANEILQYLNKVSGNVIALYGPMGAGKTTLTSALIRQLGCPDIANSPTFSIINQYRDPSNQPVYHMDWYRLRDAEEAIGAGVEDALYSGHLCIVEWPEIAEGLLPGNSLRLHIEPVDEMTRRIFVSD